MAIALDAVSSGGAATKTVTVSHTCAANAVLVVSFAVKNRGSVSPTCTYNGVSMTRLTLQVINLVEIAVFYLANPASGANNIVATDPTSADAVAVSAASYTGIGNATPEVTNGNTASSATSVTGSLTTLADNAWVIMGVGTGATQSAGTGATQRAQGNSTTAIFSGLYDNNGPKHPAGAVSEQVTFSSTDAAYTILSFKPTVPVTVTDSVSTTEKIIFGNILTEIVHVNTIILQVLTEVITTSDAYLIFRKGVKNVQKNISTWINKQRS